jgi:glycosyltransferase involved in cell wall biosynthesis
MPPERDHPAREPCDVRQRLDAERAAVEHWRRVALQREEQFSTLTRRPLVRLLLAVERRIGPGLTHARFVGRRIYAAAERLALGVSALPRVGRRHAVERPVATALAASTPTRRIAMVVVGQSEPAWARASSARLEVLRVAKPRETRAAVCRVIEASTPDLVGAAAASTEPLDPGWLDRLAAAIDGSVVAAVPLVVHPVRPLRRATPHDGRVRAAGVGLRLDGTGTPWAEALAAGSAPSTVGESAEVDAGTGAGLLVDRSAYEAAGGLAAIDDLDAAAVELGARLQARGGRVVVVPDAAVVDHRPVRSRRELGFAADRDGPGWAAAIERSGAVLRRAADPRCAPPLRFALTLGAPSAKVATRWGDWHLARALAASLRRLGHEVRVQTADQADSLAGRACDVHVVLRGLRPVRASEGQRHVLWIISHPEAIDDAELELADLVLAASPRFAEHLRARTDTPVAVMLQATDHRRFAPRPADPDHRHDVIVVAKTRDVLRHVVADALAAGLRPRIYGGGWRGLVDPSLVVGEHVENEALPIVYSSAGVVLNDHWRTMQAWGFVSNRIFDVLACGTPVISDSVDGLADLFDGAVLEYRTPAELRALVDGVLADPAAARERAARGRQLVLAKHTMDHRAGQLVHHVSQLA